MEYMRIPHIMNGIVYCFKALDDAKRRQISQHKFTCRLIPRSKQLLLISSINNYSSWQPNAIYITTSWTQLLITATTRISPDVNMRTLYPIPHNRWRSKRRLRKSYLIRKFHSWAVWSNNVITATTICKGCTHSLILCFRNQKCPS